MSSLAPALAAPRGSRWQERGPGLFAELRSEAPRWEHERSIPRSAFARLGSAGAFATRWPDGGPLSGTELGDVDVAAELARESALVSIGFGSSVAVHSDAFVTAVYRSGMGEEARRNALGGEFIGCLGVTERGAGSEVTACETRATPSGDRWLISGRKHYVSNFGASTHMVVFARTSTGSAVADFTLFVVPTCAPGIVAERHDTLAACSAGTSSVVLDRVEVGDESRVGERGSGLGQLMEMVRLERFWAAAGAVAVAELCLEMALAYAGRRRVGGLVLRRHQAIAHRLADLSVEVGAAGAMVRELVAGARSGRLSGPDSARAKLFAARTACRAADEAVQILGGRGCTEETALARIWRDVRMSRIAGGSDEVLRELVALGLAPGPLASRPEVRSVLATLEATDAP